MAVDALRSIGHEVVEFQPPNVWEAVKCYYSIMSADGGKHLIEGLEGEDPHEWYGSIFKMAAIPSIIRPIIGKLLRSMGQKRAALLTESVGLKNVYEHWRTVANSKLYYKKFTKAWENAELDAIICPGIMIYKIFLFNSIQQ